MFMGGMEMRLCRHRGRQGTGINSNQLLTHLPNEVHY